MTKALRDSIKVDELNNKDNKPVFNNGLNSAAANFKHDILWWMVIAMIAQTALLAGTIAFFKL